jgi:small subunit ribosomal protein S8
MTDPIADMLTRIRNANQNKATSVLIPASTIKQQIAEILKNEGYITSYSIFDQDGKKTINVTLKYYGAEKERIISGLKRISKPGLRVYSRLSELPKVLNGLGIAIVSTSKGIFTDARCRAEGIGGEVIAFVW